MKGILFKPDVWQAKKKVLEQYGEAMTRRWMNPQPFYSTLEFPLMNCPEPVYVWQPRKKTSWYAWQSKNFQFDPCISNDAPYQVGEVVYIKEAWGYYPASLPEEKQILFKSDEMPDRIRDYTVWRSPMFLKEIFARYFIQITAVRAERFYLDKIDPHEFILEGGETAVYMLKKLEWLWVWVYTFKPVSK